MAPIECATDETSAKTPAAGASLIRPDEFDSQASGISRRILLQGAAAAAMPLVSTPLWASRDLAQAGARGRAASGPAIPRWPQPSQTRQIWLKRQQTGEMLVARYAEGGRIRMDEYVAICRLLRDTQAGVAAYIDLELLDLIFAIQSWLVAWNIDIPIIVTSGYRTPRTNAATEGAALNSMHVKGRAVDVHMPGVPARYLGQLATVFGAGGVGFYSARGFTHLDTGHVRYWGR